MKASRYLLVSSTFSGQAAALILPWALYNEDAGLARPEAGIQAPPDQLQDKNMGLGLAVGTGIAPAEPLVTPPPSEAVVELLLKRSSSSSSSSSSNTWENDQTCGWFAALSSQPFTCESPLTCATDTDHVVACSTVNIDRFYTICLDYEAVQSSKCTSAGPKTGCCSDSASPACGTYLWTGSPTRSMFQCFPTATILSMLDEPSAVVAAQSSSSAAASSSSAAAAASRSSAAAASSSAAASQASSLGGTSVTITTTASDGSSTTFTAVAGATGTVSGVTFMTSVLYTTTGSDGSSTTYTAIAENGISGSNGSSGSSGTSSGGGSSSSSSPNIGAIVGGVVGGILGLILALLALCYMMRKKNNKFSLKLCGGKRKTKKEKHIHNKEHTENNNVDRREYNNMKSPSGSSPSSSGGKGFSLSLGGSGGEKTSKKEKNITKNYYYGDEVKNDNRSYDKRAWKDNRKYDNRSDSHSRSVTPSQQQQQQQQPQNFHFAVNGPVTADRPAAQSGRAASRGYEVPVDEDLVAIAGAGGRGSSRREQRRQQQEYDAESRSPSQSPVREAVVAGAGGGTSRRDRRKQQRRHARGEPSPSPEREPELESPTSDLELGYARERGVQSGLSGRTAGGYEVEHGYDGYPRGQPQHVHVHVHVHDREDRGRGSAQDRRYDHEEEQASGARDELEDEEWAQAQERHSGGTHRYHPGSGRRNVPASRSPSPPPAGVMPHPDDFIGRGL